LNARIEAYHDAIWQIVPKESRLERLATGFWFTEGPVWCGDNLLFSDIPQNRIMCLSMRGENPEITIFRSPSGHSNGLTLDKSGRLVACEHGTRQVTCRDMAGSLSWFVDRYEGKRLNSPNDVVVKSDGGVYFTDPPYGLANPEIQQELPFSGVYRFSPEGNLTLLVDDFDGPNGLAFSPDESVLYVDDSARGHIRAFDVTPNGHLKNGHVLIDMQLPEPGLPDGMKIDQQGNIYCTGAGGLWVIQPDGECLGRIILPELPSNLAWGDQDWQSLYITARSSIYRLRMAAPGIAVP
jgi:gluconolactonase